MTRLRIDRTEYTPASERQILSNIVDAMLEAEDKLANATSREWRETIVGYCRQRKQTDGPKAIRAATMY